MGLCGFYSPSTRTSVVCVTSERNVREVRHLVHSVAHKKIFIRHGLSACLSPRFTSCLSAGVLKLPPLDQRLGFYFTQTVISQLLEGGGGLVQPLQS